MQVDSIRKLLRYSSRNSGHFLHTPAGMTAVRRKEQHVVIKSNLSISYSTKVQQSRSGDRVAFLVPKSVTQTHGAFFVRFFTARERRDAMEATIQTIMEAALQQGIWAALYIYLFFRMLKENAAREEKYQAMIDSLSTNIAEGIEDIQNRLDALIK